MPDPCVSPDFRASQESSSWEQFAAVVVALRHLHEGSMSDHDPSGANMTFWEHLAELRGRLLRIALAVAAGATVAWFVRESVLD